MLAARRVLCETERAHPVAESVAYLAAQTRTDVGRIADAALDVTGPDRRISRERNSRKPLAHSVVRRGYGKDFGAVVEEIGAAGDAVPCC